MRRNRPSVSAERAAEDAKRLKTIDERYLIGRAKADEERKVITADLRELKRLQKVKAKEVAKIQKQPKLVVPQDVRARTNATIAKYLKQPTHERRKGKSRLPPIPTAPTVLNGKVLKPAEVEAETERVIKAAIDPQTKPREEAAQTETAAFVQARVSKHIAKKVAARKAQTDVTAEKAKNLAVVAIAAAKFAQKDVEEAMRMPERFDLEAERKKIEVRRAKKRAEMAQMLAQYANVVVDPQHRAKVSDAYDATVRVSEDPAYIAEVRAKHATRLATQPPALPAHKRQNIARAHAAKRRLVEAKEEHTKSAAQLEKERADLTRAKQKESALAVKATKAKFELLTPLDSGGTRLPTKLRDDQSAKDLATKRSELQKNADFGGSSRSYNSKNAAFDAWFDSTSDVKDLNPVISSYEALIAKAPSSKAGMTAQKKLVKRITKLKLRKRGLTSGTISKSQLSGIKSAPAKRKSKETGTRRAKRQKPASRAVGRGLASAKTRKKPAKASKPVKKPVLNPNARYFI